MAQLNNSGFDTGTNYKFGDKMIRPNFPRSAFDDSCLVTTTIDNAGVVFPIKILEVLPNSDYEISVNSLIRVLPQAVPLYSRQRLYTYAFYSRCSDLWQGFQTFITKGYSGNEIKTVPTINSGNDVWSAIVRESADWTNPQFATDDTDPQLVSGSLGDMFGLPLGMHIADSEPLNAMPFMMYLRIWRDYFCNRNFYVDDRALLPDDDSRFRLNDAGEVMSFKDIDKYCLFDVGGAFSAGVTNTEPKTVVASKGMSYVWDDDYFVVAPFYHDYPADYFTSALPWTQRGDTPTLSYDSDLNVNVTSTFSGTSTSLATGFNPSNFFNLSGNSVILPDFLIMAMGTRSVDPHDTLFGVLPVVSDIDTSYVQTKGTLLDANAEWNSHFSSWFKTNLESAMNYTRPNGTVTSRASVSDFDFKITLENLRELAIAQTIMEKMARTDGSFGEFGLTFFGEKSKAATDYRPTFIGGSYSNLVFTEVLQTSETTESSALGQYAGHGIGVQNKGYLGRFHADDYGYIMILGCIMPDVYYHQGLHKMWFRLDQSQWFLPERAELGMQPILNKEIYLQGKSVKDSDNNPVNDNLFAYQDIFDEYRFQDNQIKGQIADPSKLSFYPYTQARHFTKLPSWSQQFSEANDVRKDYLQASIESAYTAQFDLNIKAVKPLPYRARPASILNGLVS